MHRREVITTTGGVVVALAGCLAPSDVGTGSETPDDDQATTKSPTEPAYATCDSDSIPSSVPRSARTPPDSLTHEQIVTYLETVESDFVLGSNTDGYVKIGEITTESVAHGYLAQVPVNGGYYNKAKDDNPTETVHYDLGTHTTKYFLGEQIVRRVEAGDPREQGDVIACTSG